MASGQYCTGASKRSTPQLAGIGSLLLDVDQQSVQVANEYRHVLAFCGLPADLPKPWLASLLREHLDKTQWLALFGTCHDLAVTVVENCHTLHLRPAVAALKDRPANCAALSTLARGCSNIHLGLYGGSIRVSTHVAANVTELTLLDTHLSEETISHLCMDKMNRLSVLKLDCLDKKHRHQTELDETALMRALWRGSPWAYSSPVLSLHCHSNDPYDVWETLQRLSPLLGGSVHILQTCQVSALETIDSYPKLTSLTITGSPPKVNNLQWTRLQRHPSLRSVCVPGTVFDFKNDDHSMLSWPLDILRLLLFCGACASLAKLPLGDVKLLLIEGGIDGRDKMHEQMLVHLKQCPDVKFLPLQGHPTQTSHGIPADMPVMQLKNCLDREVVSLVTSNMGGGALSITMNQWQVQLHELSGLARIPPTIHTIKLMSWNPCVEMGCTWLDVWRSLPAHITHVILAMVRITKHELMAIFDDPRKPTLKKLTLVISPAVRCMRWVFGSSDDIMAAVATKWGTQSPSGVQLSILDVPE